jgi:hypothetical protein
MDTGWVMPAYQRNPKPILVNEDSPALANLDAAWRNGASWGPVHPLLHAFLCGLSLCYDSTFLLYYAGIGPQVS